MKDPLRKLVAEAGDALAQAPATPFRVEGCRADDVERLVDELLSARNGFLAYEGALHVFPAKSPAEGPSLESWNSKVGWRSEYDDDIAGLLFFAEDVFGFQFGLRNGEVFRFDPETGEAKPLCADLQAWARRILEDPDFMTGVPFARHWRETTGGVLGPGERLVPKAPFVLGGEFAMDNLAVLDSEKAMRFRGDLARQIKDLPDGATIDFQIR